jgi:hypothetical protein
MWPSGSVAGKGRAKQKQTDCSDRRRGMAKQRDKTYRIET